MDEKQWLAEQFEENRTHLRAVAYRMLGSLSEADDAVQESWLRLSRADTDRIENLPGWLTTIVARICLDMLRSRKSRREESLGAQVLQNLLGHPGYADRTNPEYEVLLADSVGLALLVVLETLAPAERVAFVLHDVFDLPFEEIAPIVGRSPAAARQLASRARRRVRGASPAPDTVLLRQKEVVNAFLAAARGGDFAALVSALDPEVVFQADHAAVQAGGPKEARGAQEVARIFSGRAQAAKSALVNGAVGIVVSPQDRLLLVMNLTFVDDRIVHIDVVADPVRLRSVRLTVLSD
ncbi:MAG: sigma-70 family RNA polymerase sigma factor [Cytophagales bacterium]|nr:sigma-70 family RNA polymerase sigma factor [Armatimonadota bacterium]